MSTYPLKTIVSARAPAALRAFVVLAALYVAVITAWVGDDIQITFRQVWNFIHGDGMTFNYGGRVQAFTHPAWFFLLSAFVAVTRELFLTTIVVSIVLSVAAVGLLFAAERRLYTGEKEGKGGRVPLLTPALLLLFSVAFCDYMTSGLENPLSYFLVGLVLCLVAAAGLNGAAAGGSRTAPTFIGADGLNDASRHRRWLFLLLALLVLNRPDYGVLFLPLSLLFATTSFKANGARGFLRDAWPGALLLFAWFAFALIYFGSPLPNTFYAKMAAGYPSEEIFERGVNYYKMSALRDPVSLMIIVAGLALSAVSRRPILSALAAGQLLYLGFILKAGGDFMQGRFFAVPVYLAVGQMILALRGDGLLRRWRRRFVIGLLLCAAVLNLPERYPFMTDTTTIYGIADERRWYYQRYGLLAPNRRWPRVATQADGPPRLTKEIHSGLGVTSLTDAAMRHVIDLAGLSDPFLARLPAYRFKGWRIGHHYRRLPVGYDLYAIGALPAIADERLRGLSRDVSLGSRAPALFTRPRFAAIWRLNTGHYSGPDLADYRPRLPLSERSRRHISTARRDLRLKELDPTPKADGYRRNGRGVASVRNILRVTADNPRPAAELQMSLSGTEDYEIHVNGLFVAAIERVGPAGGLRNHAVPLPRPTVVETVEIRALGRDEHRAFAIGHLHIR